MAKKAKVKLSQDGKLIIPPSSEMYETATSTSVRELAGIVDGDCPLCEVGHFRIEDERWCCSECGDEDWHGPIGFLMRQDSVDAEEAVRRLNENDGSEKPPPSREVIQLSENRVPQVHYDVQLQPLYSREAEEALAGSVLVAVDMLEDKQVALIRPEHFFLIGLGTLWATILNLHNEKKAVDIIIVSEALKSQGKLEEVGTGEMSGLAYLSYLINHVPSSVHAPGYAATVIEMANRRKLEETARQFHKSASDRKNGTAAAILANAHNALDDFQLDGSADGGRFVDFRDLEAQEVKYLLPRYVPIGATTLLAGDGGAGKTLLTHDLVIATLTTGSAWGQIPVDQPGPVLILTSDNSESEFASLMDALLEARGFSERPEGLFLDFDFYSLAEEGRLAYIESFCRERGVSLVIVDVLATYLGDLNENLKHEVGAVLDPFRSMLRNINAAGIVNHHLNRNYGAPLRQRIRGSGHIFNSSTSVLGIKSKEAGRSGTLTQERLRGRFMGPLAFSLEWMDSRAFLTYQEEKAGPVDEERSVPKNEQAVRACISHLREQEGIWVAAGELLRLCASWDLQISRSGYYKTVVPKLKKAPGVNTQDDPLRFQWE